MSEFKIRFSIINTIALSILAIINVIILIICFVYTSWDDFQILDFIGLLIATFIFGGIIVYCLYTIINYTSPLIKISPDGIVRKPLVGKTSYYEWNKVICVKEQFIRDYLLGGGQGYVFEIKDNNTKVEIKFFKDKKTTKMIEQLKTNSIVELKFTKEDK